MAFGPGFSGAFARGARPNPIRELNRYLEQESWFEGIVMAAVFFEAWGKDSLRLLFKRNNLPFPSILEKARVWQVISALKEFGVISDEVGKKMKEVNRWRIQLVHKEKAETQLTSEKAKTLLNDALDVMDVLAPYSRGLRRRGRSSLAHLPR